MADSWAWRAVARTRIWCFYLLNKTKRRLYSKRTGCAVGLRRQQMATRVSLDISAPVTIYLGSPIVWARMIRWSKRNLIVLDNIRLPIGERRYVCWRAIRLSTEMIDDRNGSIRLTRNANRTLESRRLVPDDQCSECFARHNHS
jgi:hypothetical protein